MLIVARREDRKDEIFLETLFFIQCIDGKRDGRIGYLPS